MPSFPPGAFKASLDRPANSHLKPSDAFSNPTGGGGVPGSEKRLNIFHSSPTGSTADVNTPHPGARHSLLRRRRHRPSVPASPAACARSLGSVRGFAADVGASESVVVTAASVICCYCCYCCAID